MQYQLIDISTAVITLTVAVVLLCLKIPVGEQWRGVRRMVILLCASYFCLGLSNLACSLFALNEADNMLIRHIVIFVAFYQALLFTATCLTFVAPHRAGIRWLSVNVAVIAIVCAANFCIIDGGTSEWLLIVDIALYIAQLVYYCVLFHNGYRHCRRALEEIYDEELSSRLRYIRNCFIGALGIGIYALLYGIFGSGGVGYSIFTVVYTLYYVYVVICIINYRTDTNVVKAANTDTEDTMAAVAVMPATEEESVAPISRAEEKRLAAAIAQWVSDKQFVNSDHTVEEIARELSTTQPVLRWYFTNRLNTNFRTWRIGLRIEEAKRLLADKNVVVAEVHRMVGVADKSNFHKQFRQATGMTPKQYKESCVLG